MDENISLTLKIIILGASEVGKTSILDRYFKDEFRENRLSTIGVDFQTKYFKFDSKKIKVNYTDTAGQEKFRAISVNYLKAANGVILVFDITKEETFEALEEWLKYLKENNKLELKKILIGNKLDLENERQVKKEDAQKFAESIGCKYYEGSAKTGYNINESLDEIARITYLYMKDNNQEEESHKDSIIIEKNNSKIKKKKCC
jgi:Ras-related protein Rab-13